MKTIDGYNLSLVDRIKKNYKQTKTLCCKIKEKISW